ncbi:MAG TPA: substrate-binding domain-containing protein [Roseiflexaceae bacterium]|nr:substrate-binding domain-containing protein [Roseiflexaceae bacterium]
MAATIGIVSIGQEPAFFAARYFREILTAAGQSAVERGNQVKIISLSHEQCASPGAARALLASQGIGALLVVAPSEALLAALGEIFSATPGIIISPPRLDIPLSYVASDNFGATRQLVEHLAVHGRRRILLLRPDILTGDYWERTRGYEAGATAYDLPRLVDALPHPITPELVERLLATHTPDALIAPGDDDALPLLGVLKRLGRRVPEDIALVGFDDEEFAAETNPPLTTVAQPIAEMARRATLYLSDRLAGVERHVYHTVLSNRLVVRESCGAGPLSK